MRRFVSNAMVVVSGLLFLELLDRFMFKILSLDTVYLLVLIIVNLGLFLTHAISLKLRLTASYEVVVNWTLVGWVSAAYLVADVAFVSYGMS